MKRKAVIAMKWMGLAIVTLSLVYAVALIASSYSLHKAYAQLERDDRPMRQQDVIPEPIPMADNAALLYQAAVSMLKAEPIGEQDAFTVLNDLAKKMLADLEQDDIKERFGELLHTDAIANALAIVQRADARSGCRYNVDWSKGATTLLPHLSPLRDLSYILSAKACVEAANGEADQAWKTLLTGLHLANALETEPFMISQLVRAAQLKITTEAIQFIAQTAPPPKSLYAPLTQALEEFENRNGMILSLDGERLLLGEWIYSLPTSELQDAIADLCADGLAQPLRKRVLLLRPRMQFDHAAYLNAMRLCSQTATGPYRKHDFAILEKKLTSIPTLYVFSRMYLPAVSAYKIHYLSMIARARISRIGLEALAQEQEQGTFPTNLGRMNTGSVLDPFTDQPLVYIQTPSGFTLYSVGKNMEDDGGVESAEDKAADDLTWRYKRL